jgi:homoserine dehydrogenase
MVRPFRIGLAGLGVVGTEVARLLLSESETLGQQAGRPIELVAYSVRDSAKDRGIDLSKVAYVGNPANLAKRDDVDVVVELMGGADGPALEAARAALKSGRHLITGNKAMLAAHWNELFDLSAQYHGAIMFEASVCGGIPVIKVLREGLAGNSIVKISGILNGTCNYILSSMEQGGASFAHALKTAQELGYAERDPTLDIDGLDTAHKLIVLVKLAFDENASLDDISVQGIRDITQEDVHAANARGETIRLIATAEKQAGGHVTMTVKPEYLKRDHPLAHVSGPMNAVTIEAQPVQTCTLIGPGAGGGPTASAVLADIIDLARFDIVKEGPLYLKH